MARYLPNITHGLQEYTATFVSCYKVRTSFILGRDLFALGSAWALPGRHRHHLLGSADHHLQS